MGEKEALNFTKLTSGLHFNEVIIISHFDTVEPEKLWQLTNHDIQFMHFV